ncbi:MAG: peptide deformylase [Alphaproteobacteria bacterium]|nr:peptide deformylase [Alphaproteobacteria bacterium]
MALLPIIWAPDPVLKAKCASVPDVDDELRRLMDDMLATMYAAPGVGLAAPQVGVLKRLIVIDVSDKDKPRSPLQLVNPTIVAVSDELQIYEEGCLSLPDLFADVERPRAVTVAYLDRDGEERKIDAEDVLAVCLQHEIDHLDGVLFTDHLSALKRNMFMKKMVKAKKVRANDHAA